MIKPANVNDKYMAFGIAYTNLLMTGMNSVTPDAPLEVGKDYVKLTEKDRHFSRIYSARSVK